MAGLGHLPVPLTIRVGEGEPTEIGTIEWPISIGTETAEDGHAHVTIKQGTVSDVEPQIVALLRAAADTIEAG